MLLIAVAYLVLAATVFAPVDSHGAGFAHLELHSKAVGRDLGVNVIVPPNAGPQGKRSLLVFLHGRGGYEGTFNDERSSAACRSLHGARRRSSPSPTAASTATGTTAPKATGTDCVMRRSDPAGRPALRNRPAPDRDRRHLDGRLRRLRPRPAAPGRFCAVGGHSPALWFDGGETAPGAFDDAADFERNDVVGTVQEDPDAFGDDHGLERLRRAKTPSASTTKASSQAMEAGDADFTTHSWPGGHEGSYWDAHWPAYQRFYVNALNPLRRWTLLLSQDGQPARLSGRVSRGDDRAAAPGPSSRGRRRLRSGSRDRPSRACRG